eukprot:m.405749 g.405749  ORF g.405749 m.405749 type:complete len:120 (-) comp16795_c3_seq25:2391-2750(-)
MLVDPVEPPKGTKRGGSPLEAEPKRANLTEGVVHTTTQPTTTEVVFTAAVDGSGVAFDARMTGVDEASGPSVAAPTVSTPLFDPKQPPDEWTANGSAIRWLKTTSLWKNVEECGECAGR